MANGNRITGLREQIMANAAIAFPWKIIKNGDLYQTTSRDFPQGIVEVVVIEYKQRRWDTSNKRACLILQADDQRECAAWGEICGDVESALESLLEQLGKIILNGLIMLPDQRESAGGDI